MRNPYVEVFRSYIRHLLSSWMPFSYALMALILIVTSFLAREMRSMSPFIGMEAIFVAMVLWAHFQEQMVSDRRKLWPKYARPHIVISTAISGAFIIGWPMAVSVAHGMNPAGLLALTTSIFASCGWFAATGYVPILILAIALQMVTMQSAAAEIVLGGRYEYPLGGVAAVALVASVLAAAWMLRLTGNDAVLTRRIQLDTWSLKPRMTGEVNRTWSQQRRLFWPSSRIYIPANTGLWERARRWRALNQGTVKLVWLPGAAMVGTLMLLGGIGRAEVQSILISPVDVWIGIMPVLMIAVSWLNFWRFLETDSLKPMDRRSFLQEIGLAITVQTLQGWSIFAGLFVLLEAWINPRVDVASLMAGLFLWLGATACGLAVAFWLMLYRSGAFILVISITVTSIVAVILFEAARSGGQPVMIMGAVVFLWLGILIARAAYRKWLVTELG
jgi:hypothetical protein